MQMFLWGLYIVMYIVFMYVMIKLTGEKHPSNKGDERQRFMAKEAVIQSWYAIMYMLFFKGIQALPFFKGIFHKGDGISFFQQPFFYQGGDILLAALVGYMMGYIISYRKLSA
ncbi:hypothetical protein [Ectobacillus panaciterrae]|uniref:hypothetical protein n=1 Tax=Ectobacillus panaciterrae TaxID=363872 RepID=UPI00041E3360|nr:hypothetical protein [Ectobacillus panaciterrae]